jgi:hypothetical protein
MLAPARPRGTRDRGGSGAASPKFGPEAGPTPAFYRGIPTRMHGPAQLACIFWASLTPFERCSADGCAGRSAIVLPAAGGVGAGRNR